MPRLFEGPKLKIDRAKRHFNELDAEIKAFFARGPYVITTDDDPKSGDRFFKLTIREDVPLSLSAIIGDLVHNLRAALDIAICDAVRSNGASVVTSNGFPIFDKRREFKREVSRKIDGTNARTRRLIHLLKPYKSGRKALWSLHNLDIVDKHNTILVAAASYRHFVLRSKLPVPWQETPVEFPGISIRPKDRLFPLKDGATVMKVAAKARRAEIEDDFEFSFEICFGEGNALAGEPLLALRDLGNMTERIVALIEGCNI